MSSAVDQITWLTPATAAARAWFAACSASCSAEKCTKKLVDAANLLAGDGGLRLSPDDAAASLLVLYSPHVAQILIEYLGWSYDRYEAWLADAIERLVLND